MNFKFRTFKGLPIHNVSEYIMDHLRKDPFMTISVGSDSIQRKSKSMYAVTIMMYDSELKKGAHIIYARKNLPKIKDTFVRLQHEVDFSYSVAQFLDRNLGHEYKRQDLTLMERKKYKHHLKICNGESVSDDINTVILTEFEKVQEFKNIDIHLDLNPFDGNSKNKSHISYKTYVPWLRGMGYRVFCKPIAVAATNGADLIIQQQLN